MIEIITNVNNLKEEDMTDFVTKVKLLLVNSNKELLLAYSHNEYQFPGGTQEEGELLNEIVFRELKEETGIEINIPSLKPFVKSVGYYKDWPSLGKNKKVEIYYYEIKTDEKPRLDKLNLTDSEKNGNFELRFVALDNVLDELDRNVLMYDDPHGIAREMKELLKIYMDGGR